MTDATAASFPIAIPADPPAFAIDCGSCAMRDTDACDGCVVSFILDRPEGAVVFDADEERAIRAMATAGLLPIVKYRPDERAV